MAETPEEETTRIRAEVAQEMEAEESGEAPAVDARSEEEPKKETVDPWAGVNPALKQAFDEMSNRVSSFQVTEARLKQAESRIGAISNELYTAKKVGTPTKEQMAAATESDEKWESLKTDFPEWAEAFDSRFDKKLTAKVNELRSELKSESAAPDLEVRLLTLVKPKWKSTVATEDWKNWLAQQPPEKQALVQSPIADDAVSILNEYEEASKSHKSATEIAAERKQRIITSVLPQGGKATPLKSEVDMTPSELRATIGKEIYAET